MVPPVRPTCGTSPPAWRTVSSRSEGAGDRGGEVGGRLVDLDAGRGAARHREAAAGVSLRAVRGVDVVLVEPAQLLGEQLGRARGA